MYENYSIHYYSVAYPIDTIQSNSVRDSIKNNKKCKLLWGLIRDTHRGCHKMKDIREFINNYQHKNIYYYYHTYNEETKQEEAQVFITYNRLENEINKDLDAYRKANQIAFGEATVTSPFSPVVGRDTTQPTTVSRSAEGIAIPTSGIQAGTIGIQGPTGEQLYVDGGGAGLVSVNLNRQQDRLQAAQLEQIYNYQHGRYNYVVASRPTRTAPFGQSVTARQVQINNLITEAEQIDRNNPPPEIQEQLF